MPAEKAAIAPSTGQVIDDSRSHVQRPGNPENVGFIDELDLAALGFSGMTPATTGRPAYQPSPQLKIYLYGYLNPF